LALSSAARHIRGAAGIPGTAPVPSSADPHAIVSITDDGSGNAMATVASTMPGDGDYVLLSRSTGYDGVYRAVNLSGMTFVLADPFTGTGWTFGSVSTGGTWAAVTQHVDAFLTDATFDASDRVGPIVLEATGNGGDGFSDTGGGGGAATNNGGGQAGQDGDGGTTNASGGTDGDGFLSGGDYLNGNGENAYGPGGGGGAGGAGSPGTRLLGKIVVTSYTLA
jgi:hypothetical protein